MYRVDGVVQLRSSSYWAPNDSHTSKSANRRASLLAVAVRAVASAAAPALLLGVLLAPLHPRRTS